MKRLLSSILCVIIFVTAIPLVSSAEISDVPDVSAESYVLYCADNGKIISSKNEHKKMKPASTTKLMTTLIALEEAAASDKQVKFTKEMSAEGSSMYLEAGNIVTLKDLVAGMMMASGNDAANAAAITVSGSSDKFADRMNERASQIGMKDTHFVTPSGLDDDNHYSTAYDMALLMSYALENDDFAELTSKKSATVNFINPADKKITYANHNKLLSLYDYCIGGKTGYTMAAGRCLVSAAKKDGLTLVCVTLNDRNDWNDHISLYDYGFDNFACFESKDAEYIIDVPCVGGTADNITIVGEKDIKIVVPASVKEKIVRKVYCDSFLYAPIKEKQSVGVIEYTLDNEILASNSLIAMKDVNSKKENKSIFKRIKELFTYG